MQKQAIILLSGGIDSATTLYWAIKKGYKCQALIFDYGQRHKKEIKSAKKLAQLNKVPYLVLSIKLPWKGSSLLDKTRKIPIREKMTGIPSTYVPARNTIFLSFALSFAESIGAAAIIIGANAVDFSGYPDCRPGYYTAIQKLANKALKRGKIKIITPLLKLSKTKIIKLAKSMGVPIESTWSCYQGGKIPCGVCDSCKIRNKALLQAK